MTGMVVKPIHTYSTQCILIHAHTCLVFGPNSEVCVKSISDFLQQRLKLLYHLCIRNSDIQENLSILSSTTLMLLHIVSN